MVWSFLGVGRVTCFAPGATLLLIPGANQEVPTQQSATSPEASIRNPSSSLHRQPGRGLTGSLTDAALGGRWYHPINRCCPVTTDFSVNRHCPARTGSSFPRDRLE